MAAIRPDVCAAEIRRKRVDRIRPLPHLRWHLDEVFVKINGERHYLWQKARLAGDRRKVEYVSQIKTIP